MSLVAYASSDESDSEDTNDFDNSSKNVEPPIDDSIVNDYMDNSNHTGSTNKLDGTDKNNIAGQEQTNPNELFSKLPTPKSTFSIPDNTLMLLNKKQPVKIILPSLSDIKGDEEEIKKPKPSTKGSGLFALLPAPKNSTSLVPNAVKNNVKKVSIAKIPLVSKSIRKTPVSSPSYKKNNNFDIDDDDESYKPESFFFNSVDDVKPDEMEPIDIPDITTKASVHLDSSTMTIPTVQELSQNQSGTSNSDISPETYIPIDNQMEVDINDEAIEKLCGVGVRKRKGMREEIIDINVDSMVGDAYMWLSKDLSKEQEHNSFKKAKNLSVVERRKHQITYLASQAKEKEMELRNQWANSRISRKQTQSKYGF